MRKSFNEDRRCYA